MTREEIFSKLASEIAERFNINKDTITDNLSLTDDIDADSIDLVELVLEVEYTFDVEIADEDVESLKTIGQLADYINEKQNN